MLSLVRRPKWDPILDQVQKGLRSGQRMAITASPGSGRTELVQALTERLDNAVKVSPLPLSEVDGPSSLLLETAAELAHGAARRSLIVPSDSVGSAERIAEALADAKKTLVIRVPSSWSAASDRGRSKAEPWQSVWRIVDVWLQHRGLATVLVSSRAALDCFSSHRFVHTEGATQLEFHADHLRDASVWGGYADAARAVHDYVGSTPHFKPWRVRAVIGVLGLFPDTNIEFAFNAATSELAGLYRSALQRREDGETISAALRRFVALRRPVDRGEVAVLMKIPRDHAVLLTECVGYGDPVRTYEPLRAELRQALKDDDGAPEDHALLGDHYRALDGASAPWDLSAPEILAWTEKAHHWAKAGALRRTEWSQLEKTGPEHYWDRGRDLSLRREYEAAADVYADCVEAYERDDYAWHYLGFNLERAGGDRHCAEAAFRKAVELAPDNPWWNSRLVTFLIHRARHEAARSEWNLARQRVDPEENLVEQSPWLAEHLHHWVAREWLEVGQPRDAHEVFAPVPKKLIADSPRLERLAREIADELEALELGHAIYPRHVTYSDRWRGPRLLPAELDGQPCSAWFPGRVVQVTPDHVDVAYADPDEDEPRQLQLSRISRDDWAGWCPTPPHESQHLELGLYGDHVRLIRTDPVAETADDAADGQRSDALLGYIRQWKQRNQAN